MKNPRDMNHIKIPIFALAIVSVATAAAQVTSIGRLPSSGYFDTETSTNIAFNVSRDDVRDFKVTLDCIGMASNCVEVAFGRDAAYEACEVETKYGEFAIHVR